MRRIVFCLSLIFWGTSIALVFVRDAGAAPVVFALNPALSQITVSGNVVADGVFSAPLTVQNPGSLAAVYAGSINAIVTNFTIEFTGSSLIAAETNAVPQQPAPGGAAGSAPADYGAIAQGRVIIETVTAHMAVRDLVLDLVSPVLAITNGTFSPAALEFTFSTNAVSTIDYLDNIGNAGSEPLTGASYDASAATASLTNSSGVPVLTIPVNMTFTETNGSLNGTTLTMIGQLVGEVLPPPVIKGVSITNQTVVLSVTNATAQSQIQVSTNLSVWSAISATATNVSGQTIFTTPVSGAPEFFRVRQ